MSPSSTVAVKPGGWDHFQTTRLVLDHVHESDVDQWHEIHADPRVWTHFPSGKHTSRATTEQLVQTNIDAWQTSGLSYWSIREQSGGPIIGCGGCRPVPDQNRWNLYYRFAPETQGVGYASELAIAAIAAANDVDPSWPVIAYMLKQNTASVRVAEKAGLIQVWEGPDEGNPDPTAVSVMYADRLDVDADV